MTEAEIALAREAVACKHWEWMPGVRWTRPDTSMWYPPAGRIESDAVEMLLDAQPDLFDPATVGCLEALVQRVLGHDGVNVIVEPRWGVGVGYRVTRWTRSAIDSYQPTTVGGMGHKTKAAALVAALKAAP